MLEVADTVLVQHYTFDGKFIGRRGLGWRDGRESKYHPKCSMHIVTPSGPLDAGFQKEVTLISETFLLFGWINSSSESGRSEFGCSESGRSKWTSPQQPPPRIPRH